MSLYASHHAALTKAGADGTMNGRRNTSASVSAAPTSQLATVGGGSVGDLSRAAGGERPRHFPPTPMQEGWAGAELDDTDSEDEGAGRGGADGGAEGGAEGGGGLAVVDDWFAVRSRIARAPQIVGDGAGQCVIVSPQPPPLADAAAAAAAASPKRRGASSSSSYASYMKGLGRSFKGLYSSGGGGSGSRISQNPNPNPDPGRPAAARGAGVAGIAPRAAVPGQRDVRVVLAYADDGASDAAVLARALDEYATTNAHLQTELDAARMQRDAAADAMEALASRLAEATSLATARERQLEVMTGVMAIHRDECAGKDAELCALRDENASLRELVERLGEPPGSVVRSGVRFLGSPEEKNAVGSGLAGMTETEEENWAARGGFATPEPAR